MVCDAAIVLTQAVMGTSVTLRGELHNPHAHAQWVLVDFCVHYIKANDQPRPKVFKLKTVDLAAGDTLRLTKRLSLAEMSTRKHYLGIHRVELLLNGEPHVFGTFELMAQLN